MEFVACANETGNVYNILIGNLMERSFLRDQTEDGKMTLNLVVFTFVLTGFKKLKIGFNKNF
jgi:hypothetical protein